MKNLKVYNIEGTVETRPFHTRSWEYAGSVRAIDKDEAIRLFKKGQYQSDENIIDKTPRCYEYRAFRAKTK